ncbi:VCBS repeat-containing protein [Geothrix sp. PMB-07]|uniref:FG-GAP repeat domain-containing protein n=1 Tax=Geothrix sp. PMB-07 TaxID=3068640 RepID=UPI002741EE79|nr:VCBS repeat-containing protein [Geothrix sp. PMB-07]WLT32423.1 VCBS repeat-containing protein [Geothrix sp. PMB-07]
MNPRLLPRSILGTLGLLALLGCSSSSTSHGPSYGEVVNAMAVADIDGNGRADILGLVSTDIDGKNAQGYVSTRLQDTAGSFVLPTRFGVGRGPANLVVADVNGDGRPDLVVANADDQSISVRLADPAQPGAFLPATVLATPGRTPLDVAVGDLDGDGRADIVVAASGANTVLVFTQNATGSFSAPLSLPVGGDPQAVTVADLDGDGHMDIAVATAANSVSVLRQLSFAPTFVAQSAVDYPTGVHPVAIKAADLHGTSKLDLLTANWGADANPGTQGLSVLSQTAPGVFAAPVHYTTEYRATALAVGDLNGDGKLDVALAAEGLSGSPGAVSVFLQDPATPGSLAAAVNYRGAWGPMGVAIADMDGDGRPDLVLADGGIVVRLNSATAPGTFGPPNFFYN